MSPTLSNTQQGLLPKPTKNTTLTKGHLVQLIVGPGTALVDVPAVDGARCDFLAIEDSFADDFANESSGSAVNLLTCQPLDSNRSFRVFVNAGQSGTLNGGTEVMAEAATGCIKAFTGSGVYTVGVLEEDAVAGQLALVRPLVYRRF